MLPVLAYVVLIFVVSSIPRLAPPGPEFSLKDEMAHFVEYFVLGVLLFRGVGWQVSRLQWATFGFLVGLAATVGALDEIYQSYIAGRDMSVTDWLADMTGAASGIGLYMLSPLGNRRRSLLTDKMARETGEAEQR